MDRAVRQGEFGACETGRQRRFHADVGDDHGGRAFSFGLNPAEAGSDLCRIFGRVTQRRRYRAQRGVGYDLLSAVDVPPYPLQADRLGKCVQFLHPSGGSSLVAGG
ncbi:hypothetical protein ACFSLT_17890 [Novosphingobium resinovorum]